MKMMDNYQIVAEIGRGSFGVVFKGIRKDNKQVVAIKKILRNSGNEAELKEMRAEYEIQRRLSHPNIISVFESFETKECIWIVLEYAGRGDLANLIATTRGGKGLPTEQVVRITCDLVSALAYLFNQRTLHRDLKPQNVLIGNNGVCKLCDFGFAKKLDVNHYLLTSIKGTPLYMAPEMITHSIYDENAELWSLGCIVYQMISGKPPYSTPSILTLVKMLEGDLRLNMEGFTRESEAFVRGLLQKDPRKRLSLKEVIIHPFLGNQVKIEQYENSLGKALTPSEERVKNAQRFHLERQKCEKYGRALMKAERKICKVQKELDKLNISPNKNEHIGVVLTKHQKGFQVPIAVDIVEEKRNITITPVSQDNDGNSESSCETLTSSSDEENGSDDEQRTIVNGSGDADARTPAFDENLRGHILWTTKALFHLPSIGVDDNRMLIEEWIPFLLKTMKDMTENQESWEKHCLTMIVAPLRNSITSPELLEKIADVLTLPFILGTQSNLKTVFLDSKVLPNMLYACKATVVRRTKESCDSLNELIPELSKEDLNALYKCLRLVSYLVFLDSNFVVHLCDSIYILQLFPILLLFLKLDSNNVCFAEYTLSLLCHLMRILPMNYYIVEELFFGNCPLANNVDEFWRMLSHKNTAVRSSSLRILTYLSINSEPGKGVDVFIRSRALELWQIIKDAMLSDDITLTKAARFASANIPELNNGEACLLSASQKAS